MTSGKLMASLAAVTMVGVVGVVGTRAAISDTTENLGNEFNAGEITLADNDSDTVMYDVNNALPGDYVESCIKVTYTTTAGAPALNSDVELYMTTPIGDVGPFVNMTIEAGAQPGGVFPDCTGFVPDGGPIYTGTLADFQSTHNGVGSGLVYSPHGASPWVDGDSVVYKVRLELSADPRDPGDNFSGVHAYTWRAETV